MWHTIVWMMCWFVACESRESEASNSNDIWACVIINDRPIVLLFFNFSYILTVHFIVLTLNMWYCMWVTTILASAANSLVYIFRENQQVHQNEYFIVMLSQTFLHVSAYQRHHQGAHMILTSCLYVGVLYRKNKWLWLTAAGSSG
jgi:hypothetical protein